MTDFCVAGTKYLKDTVLVGERLNLVHSFGGVIAGKARTAECESGALHTVANP